MDDAYRESALSMRARLIEGDVSAPSFRAALTGVPFADRDAWADVALGLEGLPEDGPDLPRGCAPYVPCSVDVLLRVIDEAEVSPSDVVIDVGSGVGRAMALVHLCTGASAIGVEIQHALVRASRELAANQRVSRVPVVAGDATRLAGLLAIGTVFFLYCPFTGERLEKLVGDLEPIARTRPIRVCCVDLVLPPRPWLSAFSTSADLTIYRSTFAPAGT